MKSQSGKKEKPGKRMLPFYCNMVYYRILSSINDKEICLYNYFNPDKSRITLLKQIQKLEIKNDCSVLYRQIKNGRLSSYIKKRKEGRKVLYSLSDEGKQLLLLQNNYFRLTTKYNKEVEDIKRQYEILQRGGV